MAVTATTTESERWASAKINHSVAMTAWAAVVDEPECPARDHVARGALDARNATFAVRAPDLRSVAEKISNWFGDDLFCDDYGMGCHRKLLGDLRRIEMLAAGATEAEASGRSPELVAAQTAAWQEAVADYKDDERLLIEGPSPRWGRRDGADLVDSMEYLASVMLDLPAPNLAGVIFKLEMLWEQDRFDTVAGGAFYVEIMRDGTVKANAPAGSEGV